MFSLWCVRLIYFIGPWGNWHHQGSYGNYGNYGYGYDQNYGYHGYDYNSSYNYGAPAPGYGAPNYGNTAGYDYNNYSGYSGELNYLLRIDIYNTKKLYAQMFLSIVEIKWFVYSKAFNGLIFLHRLS